MKAIIFLVLVLFTTQVLSDDIDCTTLKTSAECQAQNSKCAWINDFTQNTCQQSTDCSTLLTQPDCQAKTGICDWSGFTQGCRNNDKICLINTSNYSCNTGIGCIQGQDVQCKSVLIDQWGCDKLELNNCNTKNTPYCVQGNICNYNKQKQCPTTVSTGTADQDCSGPCKLGEIICTSACTGKDQTTCGQTQGCEWSDNSCSNKKQCPQFPTSVNQCTSVQGCQVTQATITCSVAQDYQAYCFKSKCTDNVYCTQAQACVSDNTFCSKKDSCGDPAPYKQCLQVTSKSCKFPDTTTKCDQINNQQDCQNNSLCLWSNGLTCNNSLSNSDCSVFYRNSTSCKSYSDKGCVFQLGGVCTSKEADNLSSQLLTYKMFIFTALAYLLI